MALSQYVHVNIAVGTASPTGQGFGNLLLLAAGTGSNGFTTTEVRTYRNFSSLAEDFNSDQWVYAAAQAAFSQNPRPELIKVGLLPPPSTAQTFVVSLNHIASGSAVTGSLISPAGSSSLILADSGATTAQTALNLANAIGAISGISASSAGNVVTATAGGVGEFWHFSSDLNNISIYDTTVDLGYDDQLDDLLAISNDFYAVAIDNNSAKNMDKVARWASANNKLAFFSPQFTRPADFTSSLFTATADYDALLANDRAILLFTKDTRLNAKEVAWAASGLVEDPGTITWAFKTLEGVASDSYTSTEETTILSKGGNLYKTEAGIDITWNGKGAGGEYIDVTRSIDWLKARIEERIFGLFVNSRKVPYTNAGIAAVVAEIKGQLSQAERLGVVDADWVVEALPVSLQATADRTNRIVREVSFQARLAGAIHEVYIVGTVTA